MIRAFLDRVMRALCPPADGATTDDTDRTDAAEPTSVSSVKSVVHPSDLHAENERLRARIKSLEIYDKGKLVDVVCPACGQRNYPQGVSVAAIQSGMEEGAVILCPGCAYLQIVVETPDRWTTRSATEDECQRITQRAPQIALMIRAIRTRWEFCRTGGPAAAPSAPPGIDAAKVPF